MYSYYLNFIISNKYFDSYKLGMTLTINGHISALKAVSV